MVFVDCRLYICMHVGLFCQPAVSCIISSYRWGKIQSERHLMITFEVCNWSCQYTLECIALLFLLCVAKESLDLLKIKLMFCSVPNASQTLQHYTEVHRNFCIQKRVWISQKVKEFRSKCWRVPRMRKCIAVTRITPRIHIIQFKTYTM